MIANPVLRVPPASPADAFAHFTGLLAFATDVSDVHTALEGPEDPGFTLVDTRGRASWDQGRVPGAVHLPTDEIAARAEEVDPARPVVVYCWGPGCNGAYRAAAAFARLGYQVKYMMGGFEYWVREGLPVATDAGVERGEPDPLTAPAGGVSCAC